MPTPKITRAYVRRYSDTGQAFCFVEYADGSRTSGARRFLWQRRNSDIPVHGFGAHMHALVQRASREGIKLQRETW